MKAKRPDVRVVGVQAETAAAYPASLAAGRARCRWTAMATMADGIAVGCPARCPSRIVRELVDDVATVSEESLSRALLFLLERAKLVVEPAGAAAVAAPARLRPAPPTRARWSRCSAAATSTRCCCCGSSATAWRRPGATCSSGVRVPDRPGRWPRLLADLAEADANVLEVEHVRTGAALHVDEVEIAVQLETKGARALRGACWRRCAGKGYDLVFA